MLLASCGGGGASAPPDQMGPCGPVDSMSGGQVELGTGNLAFEPMPDMLPIIMDASQAAPHLLVQSRIRGIPPGDPDNLLDPGNPQTKVSVVIDALGVTLGGAYPARYGYVPSPDPGASCAFDLKQAIGVSLEMTPPDQAAGQQARITIVVTGSNGVSGQDMKLVTLTPPAAASSTPAAR